MYDDDILPDLDTANEEAEAHDAREYEEVEKFFFFRGKPTEFDQECPF